MRNCKQKNCTFLQLRAGCRRCSFCSASPFLIADDCPTCWECENVPGACRWGDENTQEKEEKEKEQEKEEEKPMVIA